MTPCRLLNLALIALVVVLLRMFERTAKCPYCAQRAGREWRGMVGTCRACGKPFRV